MPKEEKGKDDGWLLTELAQNLIQVIKYAANAPPAPEGGTPAYLDHLAKHCEEMCLQDPGAAKIVKQSGGFVLVRPKTWRKPNPCKSFRAALEELLFEQDMRRKAGKV